MAACVNGEAIEKERAREREAAMEEEKLINSSVLLIAEMQCNLFKNMQIQQSLCLVYRRDLLIQSLKAKEANLQWRHKSSQQELILLVCFRLRK